ncbi:MAG: N-formylglutamate amidohydrolase [Pirellulales bacterium]
MSRRVALVVTCEHGGNEVPPEHAAAFEGAKDILDSHRGYDPGTLELAGEFAAALAAPLHVATVSRLVVELNRSPHHRALFSEFTRGLSTPARGQLIERHYRPYRDAVEARIADVIGAGAVALHVSVHSFTPVFDGVARRADVGLLYDPRRTLERQWCGRWRDALVQRRSDLLIRRNYPYRGVADGFVTHLRRTFSEASYVGVELEVNQKFPLASGSAWTRLKQDLAQTLATISRTTSP